MMSLLPTAASSCISRASMSSTSPTRNVASGKRRVSIGTFQQLLTIAPSSGDSFYYNDFVNSSSSSFLSTSSSSSGGDCIGALTTAASTVVSSVSSLIKSSLMPSSSSFSSTSSTSPSPSPPPAMAATIAPPSAMSTVVIKGTQSNNFPTEDHDVVFDTMLPTIGSERRRPVRRMSTSSYTAAPVRKPISIVKPTSSMAPTSISPPPALDFNPKAAKQIKSDLVDFADDVFASEETQQSTPFFRRGCPSRRTVAILSDGRTFRPRAASDIFGAFVNTPTATVCQQQSRQNNFTRTTVPVMKSSVFNIVARKSPQPTFV